MQIFDIIAEQLEQELRRTKGVASVTVSGKLVEEVQITLDEKKLETEWTGTRRHCPIIQANNVSMPGEPIETKEGKQLTTRIVSMLTSVEDIKNLTVTVNPVNGKKVKISDIGKVELS